MKNSLNRWAHMLQTHVIEGSTVYVLLQAPVVSVLTTLVSFEEFLRCLEKQNVVFSLSLQNNHYMTYSTNLKNLYPVLS